MTGGAARAVLQRDPGAGADQKSGTLITIETLEGASAATGTAQTPATGTQPVESATATAETPPPAETAPAAATDTAAAAPEPQSPEAPAPEPEQPGQAPEVSTAGEIPEAQKSPRYEQVKQDVSEPGSEPASQPAQGASAPVETPLPEPGAETSTTHQQESAATAAPPEETVAQPAPDQPAVEPAPPSGETAEAAPPETGPATEAGLTPETVSEPVEPEAEGASLPEVEAGTPPVSEPVAEQPAPEPAVESLPASEVPPSPEQSAAQPATPPGEPAEGQEEPGQPPAAAPAAEAGLPADMAPAAAPPEQPAAAAEPVVEFIPAGKYVVRSGPIMDEEEKEKLLGKLRLHEYHPAVREESLKDGETGEEKKYYIIEMGRLDDVAAATRLIVQLREISKDFFIAGADGGGPGGMSPESLARLFPRRMGEGGGDSMTLLEDYFRMRGEIAGGEAEAGKPGVLMSRKKMRLLDEAETPVFRLTEEDRRINLRNRLRQIAWDMRASGFDVDIEGEEGAPLVEPEGVLVGLFETEQEALELAGELNGYGYGVNVVHTAETGGAYYVYANPSDVARDITIIDPAALADHSTKAVFNPPPDPAADALLKLIGKSRN